jgi:hypothetical protein
MALARGLASLMDRSLGRGDASASFLGSQDQHSILIHREGLDLSLKGLEFGIKLRIWARTRSGFGSCGSRLARI